MEIKCSKCRFKFEAPDGDGGMVVCACPRCGNKFETASPVAPKPQPPMQPQSAPKIAQQSAPQPVQQPVIQLPTQQQPQVIYVKSQSNNTVWWAATIVVVLLAGAGAFYLMQSHGHQGGPTDTEMSMTQSNAVADDHGEPETASEGNVAIAASNEPQIKQPEQKVYMSLWGSIGQDNTSELEMDGETGWYVPYEGAPRRTLKLESYDPQTNQCVLSAFLNGEKFGRFEGIFQSFSVTDDTGEEHYGQTYEGTFSNLRNGIKLKFYLYAD